MKLGINVKEIATKAAGHAVGAVAFTQLNKLKFMQDMGADPKKAALKGAVVAGLGYVVAPKVAKAAGLSGKKNAFVDHVGEGIGMIGMMMLGNALVPAKDGKPALFPTISGYEENPIQGLGIIVEDELNGIDDEDNVNGYERNPIIGNDATPGDLSADD